MRDKMKHTKKKLMIAILSVVTVLCLAGGTYAWFRFLQQLHTVSLVQMPSKITISGANRSEMTRISLELTPDDTHEGDQVTIRRVFCIESTADYWLEVIRTTNINDMTINIYPVLADQSDLSSGSDSYDKGKDGTNTYYYNPEGTPVDGDYLNNAGNNLAIQIDEIESLHDKNYLEGDNVQKNAEPLYWRTDDKQTYDLQGYSKKDVDDEEIKMYYRYYVLELKWKNTDQETDMVYLLASH